MDKSKVAISLSIPSGTIFLILALLKLIHVINCSWWIVTIPLWAPIAIVGIILLFILIVTLFVFLAG